MGFFTYWYKKQLKKDMIKMTNNNSSNKSLLNSYKDSFFFNLQLFNELFYYLTNSKSMKPKFDVKKRKLILIGTLNEEENEFFNQINEKYPSVGQSILFFNTFDCVEQFFNCLFETDPEIQSQKYISNFSFYFLGKANTKVHLSEILKFFNFFEKYNFDIKLYLRLIYFNYIKLFSSFSSYFPIKNLQFYEFTSYVELFLMNN
jgi:hypothetical protein